MDFSSGIVYGDDRKPAAVNYYEHTATTTPELASASQSRAGSRRNSYNSNSNITADTRNGNLSNMIDESSLVVERILSAIELRGENGLNHHGGPLTNVEIVKLSLLCTKQAECISGNKSRGNNNNKDESNNVNDGSIFNEEDLGFADVDADMMAQLVEHLEKHVALASQIDVVQSSYNTIQKLKKQDGMRHVGCRTIDEVSRKDDLLAHRRTR